MELHIMDASNYIYAGSFSDSWVTRGVRQDNSAYRANEAPIGGVKFLLSEANKLNKDYSIVMPVFDRTPYKKREMYTNVFGDPYGYKGTRPPAGDRIVYQKQYAELIMRDLGFVVQAADDYEADDVIYSVVKAYKDDFSEIYIHTRDSDLTFLVSENVEIAKVGTQGKAIGMDNYAQLARTDKYTWYNTVLLSKLYYGDTSDNIPGVGNEWAERVDSVIPKDMYTKLGDLDLCRKYLREAMIAFPTCPNARRLLDTFNILSPLDVPKDMLSFDESDVNTDKLKYYYLDNWNQQNDAWHLEDMLAEYIDKYFE